MWRLDVVGHKSGRPVGNLEELKLKRREQEKALRQARRDHHLTTKRLLLCEDEDEADLDACSPEDFASLLNKVQHGGADRQVHLRSLIKTLRTPDAQLSFIRLENSMHLLVGFLSGSDAQCRFQSVRCLHELSLSPHPIVAQACLPATPYLLTYLSGQSTKFTELCLYTLSNLCPDSDEVKEKLLAQGIVPALATCLENQRHNAAVVEAVAFALSHLLQTQHALQKTLALVQESRLPSLLLSVLKPDSEFVLGPAVECAWCLHYLASSSEQNSTLLALGALTCCSSLLRKLTDAVANGNQVEGLELLLCPLIRVVGNLLASCSADELGAQLNDSHLVETLCWVIQAYHLTQPSLARESVWALNNLTGVSPVSCAALLKHNKVPGLLQLLSFSDDVPTLVLRVMGNIAYNGKEFSLTLVTMGILPALSTTLKMSDRVTVSLSLDILYTLVESSPEVAGEFVKVRCRSTLEALQFNGDDEIRQKASNFLEHHLLS